MLKSRRSGHFPHQMESELDSGRPRDRAYTAPFDQVTGRLHDCVAGTEARQADTPWTSTRPETSRLAPRH